ncbi:hypothetical protein LAZ67_6003225 [Cordylochernes scorpioides]|uniref:DUF5641 domain-containing protein n=1 Tax=Cordylochernes scorpioides TaxID=51811 RepID=A0ABY6KKD3_9ARAC|nr:hypothetical protein LAZ67_6003225 [Cordylochernes scorpioides]
MIMQELWKKKINWDESIPENVKARWNSFQDEIGELNKLKIPRYIMTDQTSRNIHFHGFGDVSRLAYSAVCYLRSETSDGRVEISLLAAKTRIAPCENCTFPRLELCAALLLSQLYKFLVESLKLNFSGIYLWSDSQIALCWIRSDPNRWKKFISNRVMKIQHLTERYQWNHVSGKENPANCASRGLIPSVLIQHSIWWQGPSCLKDTHTHNGITHLQKFYNEYEIHEEERAVLSHHIQSPITLEFKNIYFTFTRLKRVTAWCIRFLTNSRLSAEKRVKGQLNTEDMSRAIMTIIVRRVIRTCLTWLKLGARTAVQIMGDLPPDRINPYRPFLNNGVDLAGPFLLKPSLIRCESLIKSYIVIFICFSVKANHIHDKIVKRVSKTSLLNLEEFATLLCQIEACLNFRPLVELSPDPSDLQALTPGHFLIGTFMIDQPGVRSNIEMNLTTKWCLIKKNERHILDKMVKRKKWRQVKNNIEVDKLVLIKEDGLPPLKWRLARVIEVYQRDDGRVRFALIKSAKGVSRRPITKLASLPF